jgi:hypothetical protein
MDGSLAEFRLYGRDLLTTDVMVLDVAKVEEAFPKISTLMESAQGPIDVLIDKDHMCEALREHEDKGRLVL